MHGWVVVMSAAAVACTPEATGPHVISNVRIELAYDKTRPDGSPWDKGISPMPEPIATVQLDGREVARCDHRPFKRYLMCTPDSGVVKDDSRITLVVVDDDGSTFEPMGRAVLDEPLARRGDRRKAKLASTGAIHEVVLHYDAEWEPVLRTGVARPLVGFAGAVLALTVFALTRSGFTRARGKHSIAWHTANVALGIAFSSLLVLADLATEIEPFLVALPMGLGGYALVALAVDAYAAKDLGRRLGLMVFAVVAIVAGPLLARILVYASYVTMVVIAAFVFLLFG